MIKRDILKHILLVITILFTCFIFANSMFPADISAEHSGNVLDGVTSIFSKFNLNISVTEHFIRKSAHFIEYSILGCLLLLTEIEYTNNVVSNIFKPLFVGLLTPVIDETIQLFVEGRSGQVSDILLDFSGVLFGVCIIFIIYILFISKKRYTAFIHKR